MSAYSLLEIAADKFCRAVADCQGQERMSQAALLEVMKQAKTLRSCAKAAACWEITQELNEPAAACTDERVNEMAEKYIAEVLK